METLGATDRRQKVRRRKSRLGQLAVALVLAVCFWIIFSIKLQHSIYTPIEQQQALVESRSSTLLRSNTAEYQLAADQSFGFFDDITELHWKRAQEIHVKLFPNHYGDLTGYSNGPGDKGKMGALKKSNWWNGENFQVEFHCPLAQRVPTDSQADGPKWICDPHRLRSKTDCLIYSVGSNGKPEFEKGAKDEIGDNCEIHTFDMERYNKRNGLFATALEGYATFHHWGLGTEAQARNNPKRFKTLAQTMDSLGHTGRTIDIFKIDCEWCEWFTYEEWLKEDVRQILVETHNAPMPDAKNFFYELHDAGYVIFSKEANYQNQAGGVEFAFLKLSKEFFVNRTMYKNL